MSKQMKDSKKIYVRLGAKATMFNDPQMGIIVRNKEVISFPEHYRSKSKRIDSALRHGHLEVATESEYSAYIKANNIKPEAQTKVNYNIMDKEEILKFMSDQGYEEADLVKAGKIKEIVDLRNFAVELESQYE